MITTRLPICLKRVNKEIENFYHKKYISNASKELKNFFDRMTIDIISKTKTNSLYEQSYFLNILIDNKFYLELSIPSDYPFKPYDIINSRLHYSVKYFKQLNNLYEKIKFQDKQSLMFFFENQYQMKPKFLNLNLSSCYCCNSITCRHNWSPNCRIDDILLEYLELEFIQKYSSKLGYKYLKNIYNNLFKNTYFSKLPAEVINLILKKINII